MAQYKLGTVDVQNGSATVTLNPPGEAIANIPAGGWFILLDESVGGAMVPYFVASTPVSNSSFSLTAPWTGATAAAKIYTVVYDFDINGIPILTGEEAGFAAIWNRTMQILSSIGGGGGGGGGNFQTLLGGFAFTGVAGQVAAVNAAETSLEPRDIRFVRRPFSELAPNNVTSRVVHYSALIGSFNTTGARVVQANDISGNSRHALAAVTGPLLVGDPGRASYGMNFESTGVAGDDVNMLATVPIPQNDLFLYYIGRVDIRHAASQNLWKTAHDTAVDVQTAGDIELAPASSGNVLNLRISTSAGLGQLIPLGSYKNGLPFVLCLNISSGTISGWVQGQGELTATEFTASYNHGAGFDANRVRLGLSPDVITAHTMHEFLIGSALQSSSNLRRLTIWAQNQYFRSPLSQDEPGPRFTSPLWMSRQPILAARRGVVATDGVNIQEFLGQSLPVTTIPIPVSRDWSGGAFVHTGGTALQIQLPAAALPGFYLDIVQLGTSTGSIEILLESGATNSDGFTTTVAPGERLRVSVELNATGSTAAYSGAAAAGGGGGGGEVGPGDIGTLELADGAVTYAKINAAVKKAQIATPTEGIFVLDDDNSGQVFKAMEAVQFEIANDVSAGSRWELISRTPSVSVVIEGDAGDIVFDGASVDEVTLGNGGYAQLDVDINPGTAPEVSAVGFDGAAIIALDDVDFGGFEIFNFAERINPLGNITGSVTIDFFDGTIVTATLTGNVTALSLEGGDGMPVGASMRLLFALATFTLAMPTGSRFHEGDPPDVGTGLVDLVITKSTAGPVYDVRLVAADVAT